MSESLKMRLISLEACPEAVAWVADRDLTTAWRECERADWMVWLCGKMLGKTGWPTRQQIVLAACACAETSLRFVATGDRRPAQAIEVARDWARGNATLSQVLTATDAATAAYIAASYAARAAAAAASYAATTITTTNPANAASCAAAAAASTYAFRGKAREEMADIVRKMLKVPGGTCK